MEMDRWIERRTGWKERVDGRTEVVGRANGEENFHREDSSRPSGISGRPTNHSVQAWKADTQSSPTPQWACSIRSIDHGKAIITARAELAQGNVTSRRKEERAQAGPPGLACRSFSSNNNNNNNNSGGRKLCSGSPSACLLPEHAGAKG